MNLPRYPKRLFIAAALGVFALLSAVPAARAAEAMTLQAAVDLLAAKVVKAGKLKGAVVTVSANDIYDTDSNANLPLSERLRDMAVAALKKNGVKIRQSASLEDDQWSLHVQWKKDAGVIHMTALARLRARHGSERAIARRARVQPSSIDAALLRSDPRSVARTVVRNIEKTSKYRYTRSIHLRPVAAHKDDDQQKVSKYFGALLKTALVESSLLHLVDQSALYTVPVKKLRTRGIKRVKKNDEAKKNNLGLTSDLLGTDSELVGGVDMDKSKARLSVKLNDRAGMQLASADGSMALDLLPQDVVKAMQSGREKPGAANPLAKETKGLVVELATTRGEGKAVYKNGELIRFLVRVNRDAFVYLFDLDSEGKAAMLFPDPEAKAIRLKKGIPVVLPDDNVDYDFEVQEPFGRDTILVVATETPLSLPAWAMAEGADAGNLRDELARKARELKGTYAETELEIVTREK